MKESRLLEIVFAVVSLSTHSLLPTRAWSDTRWSQKIIHRTAAVSRFGNIERIGTERHSHDNVFIPFMNGEGQSRRVWLRSITMGGIAAIIATGDRAEAETMTSSSSSSSGLLASRVRDNALTPPPYGMGGSDVFYPRYIKWSL